MPSQRRAFYIDGFNLYFGLKAKGWRKYYWLDLHKLCSKFLHPDDQLVIIRYFTARISGPDKRKIARQRTYLEALETLPKLQIHYGHYIPSTQVCLKCGNEFTKYNEKKSDVNIAIYMLTDALDDLYDVATLISADSDLVPAVEAIRKHASEKKIGLLLPPERNSAALSQICHFRIGTINEGIFRKSQLPHTVFSKVGYKLECPKHWRQNSSPSVSSTVKKP